MIVTVPVVRVGFFSIEMLWLTAFMIYTISNSFTYDCATFSPWNNYFDISHCRFFLGAHLRIWHFIKHGKGPKLQFWCCNLTWYFYPVISLGVSFPSISYPFSLKSHFWVFGVFDWGFMYVHSCIVLTCAVNLVCSSCFGIYCARPWLKMRPWKPQSHK